MVELVALAALLVAAASGEEREAGRGRRVRAYRGTQRSSDRTVRGSASYTPSLGAAVIWSAVPGSWHGEPHLLPSSSVSLVELPADRVFVIGEGSTTSTVGEVVRALQIEEDEVRKIFNYLHNRLLGKARGGEFGYRVVDDDGEEVEEGEVPFSLLHPETLLSACRDELWHDPSVVDRVTVDAFVLADAPAVQRALARNGYDAVAYRDVFQGGTRAARVLLGVDVLDLPGVEESPDLRDEEVPSHLTIRPVDPASVEVLWCRPSAEVVEEVRKELLTRSRVRLPDGWSCNVEIRDERIGATLKDGRGVHVGEVHATSPVDGTGRLYVEECHKDLEVLRHRIGIDFGVLIVASSSVTPMHQGKGFGLYLYERVLLAAAEMGFALAPAGCDEGRTSSLAYDVWERLASLYPSEGSVVWGGAASLSPVVRSAGSAL